MRRKRIRRSKGISPYRQHRICHAQRMQQIVSAVSLASGIDVPTLRSQYRATVYVDARFAIVRLGRRECISFPQMGLALGGRNHTTILSALRRADYFAAVDPVRGARIMSIEAEAMRILAGIELPEQPKPLPVAAPPPPPPMPPPRPRYERRHGTVDRFGNIICNS